MTTPSKDSDDTMYIPIQFDPFYIPDNAPSKSSHIVADSEMENTPVSKDSQELREQILQIKFPAYKQGYELLSSSKHIGNYMMLSERGVDELMELIERHTERLAQEENERWTRAGMAVFGDEWKDSPMRKAYLSQLTRNTKELSNERLSR